MAIDLTGGLDVSREYVFAQRPDNPEMRDSVSMWISDDRGELGLPRVGIEAVASDWETHGLQLNVAFPDGRVYRLREPGKALPAVDADGLPAVLGAGPLAFRCVEPFKTWTATFRGTAVRTSTEALIAGQAGESRAELEFHVEATMAVPPWIQGSLLPDAAERLESSVEGDLMGGARYEQLFRARGTLRVGEEEHTFTGSGLRIRRQGIRRLAEFWGHCWQSALFPSGRGFGYIAYPPRADGAPTFNEGYLVIARPRPVQDPIPIWIGGNSLLSRRRAAERAQGWMPMSGGAELSATARTPALGSARDLAITIAELREKAATAGRSEPIDVLYSYQGTGIHSPAVEPDRHREAFAEIEKAGVTWAVVSSGTHAPPATLEFLAAFGSTYLS